jgi:hypothetical protein
VLTVEGKINFDKYEGPSANLQRIQYRSLPSQKSLAVTSVALASARKALTSRAVTGFCSPLLCQHCCASRYPELREGA